MVIQVLPLALGRFKRNCDPKRHNDYGYTQARVDFLVEKLKDTAEFYAVCKSDQASAATSQLT